MAGGCRGAPVWAVFGYAAAAMSDISETAKAVDTEAHDPGPADTKSYRRILEEEIEVGLEELGRPARGLFLSGLSAGLDIGFSVLLMAVVATLATGELPAAVVTMLEANAYAIGFIFVILGRSELFTEHTTLAALPVFDGRAGVGRLLRLWGLVYASNIIGAVGFACFMSWVGPALGTMSREAIGEIAHRLVAHEWWVIALSAVLAGWLMGLLSWLVAAGRDTISKIFIVWLVTSAIGLAGLHHSIVGAVEVAAGLFVGLGTTWYEAGRFALWATVGNAVGGVIFVALVKWGHATQTKERGEERDREKDAEGG